MSEPDLGEPVGVYRSLGRTNGRTLWAAELPSMTVEPLDWVRLRTRDGRTSRHQVRKIAA